MKIQALVCVRCGGPLPLVELPAMVECGFCGVGLSLADAHAVISREASLDEVRSTNHAQQRKLFLEMLSARLGDGADPETALSEAAAAHLGEAGQSKTLTTIVLTLAREFDRENNVTTIKDAGALARIAEGYLKATVELRSIASTELNLPFLTANATGPKHLLRTLSAKAIQQLVSGEVLIQVAPSAPPVAEPEPPPEPEKKKSGWWPF